ncbi:MAG TPA: SDR family NAD(P)-dependent oxidoreductase [Actinomycetota bacterium]|jgi:NAD(P)-dependent dehydrogenase (short-subunit alcohol dehydrogenase family)
MDISTRLACKRVLITGAARGIGAALAQRLHERGARVALVGLEEKRLEAIARSCGNAHWKVCDVSDRDDLRAAVETSVDALGGLDVVVANAGIAAQLPLAGGEPEVMDRIISVNVLGVYNTIWAGAPHVSHTNGYVVLVSSFAAAVHLPLMGAYSASKAAVEALGNTLRVELRPWGAKVGVAYFAELDTDVTRRGYDTRASRALPSSKWIGHGRPLDLGIDALERGIARRSRRIIAPRWMTGALPFRMAIQPVIERVTQPGLAKALEIAREEQVALTTAQPDENDD